MTTSKKVRKRQEKRERKGGTFQRESVIIRKGGDIMAGRM
jgi:hypothetical protein